jgi:xanthine dehydrogenase accessory factor
VPAPEIALPLPRTAPPAEVLTHAAEAATRGIAAVLATVLHRRGSTPATPGQKLLLTAEGLCVGTLGGGALERSVLADMVALLAALIAHTPSAPRTVSLNLGAGLGMCCGGGVEVLLEPFASPAPLLLVGAGHIAAALTPLLLRLGFAVTVCDEREAWADSTRLPGARVIAGSFRDAAPTLPRHAAVLVMSHDHALDQDAVEWALREGFAFVGAVGSRAKAARTRARLEARGFSAEQIARVRIPLGVTIGARSPEEIAVSIAAEMIAWRAGAARPAPAVSSEREAE